MLDVQFKQLAGGVVVVGGHVVGGLLDMVKG
jgi:hypothetical protein